MVLAGDRKLTHTEANEWLSHLVLGGPQPQSSPWCTNLLIGREQQGWGKSHAQPSTQETAASWAGGADWGPPGLRTLLPASPASSKVGRASLAHPGKLNSYDGGRIV